MTKEDARKLGRDIGRSAGWFLLVWTLAMLAYGFGFGLAAVGHGAGILLVVSGIVLALAAILLGWFLLDRVGQ